VTSSVEVLDAQRKAARTPVPEPPATVPAVGCAPTEMVALSELILSGSPRLGGVSLDHSRMLAGTGAELPPIIVHRSTMRVIDGAHRVSAALLRGDDRIAVRFFDGDEKDAFVLAVRTNIAHGLPLPLADRTAAAARIIGSHGQWSDRAIGAATGLSHKTVAAIRRSNPNGIFPVDTRIGRDGRLRPLTTVEGREAAAALIAAKPGVSLREIARETGISMGTARDVRARLERGEDPVLPGQRGERGGQPDPRRPPGGEPTPLPQGGTRQAASALMPASPPAGAQGRVAVRDHSAVIERMRRDPSLRLTNSGRLLLRLLDRSVADTQAWRQLAGTVPPHWSSLVAEMARSYAVFFAQVADLLDAMAAR
jgi:hypothetical protein